MMQVGFSFHYNDADCNGRNRICSSRTIGALLSGWFSVFSFGVKKICSQKKSELKNLFTMPPLVPSAEQVVELGLKHGTCRKAFCKEGPKREDEKAVQYSRFFGMRLYKKGSSRVLSCDGDRNRLQNSHDWKKSVYASKQFEDCPDALILASEFPYQDEKRKSSYCRYMVIESWMKLWELYSKSPLQTDAFKKFCIRRSYTNA